MVLRVLKPTDQMTYIESCMEVTQEGIRDVLALFVRSYEQYLE